jgi:hypothetical protein
MWRRTWEKKTSGPLSFALMFSHVSSLFRSVLELLDKWMNSDQTVYPLLGAAAVTFGTMGLGLWIASARSGNGRIETIVDPEMQTRQLKVSPSSYRLSPQCEWIHP